MLSWWNCGTAVDCRREIDVPQSTAVALTGMIEGKRARGRQRKTFMDWIYTACGDKWNINEILKICRDRNEHLLIANVRV